MPTRQPTLGRLKSAASCLSIRAHYNHEGTERLYFVVETKGSLFAADLRGQEAAKIACGKAHFAAIAAGHAPARFVQATKLEDVLAQGGG